jgi:ketosteroid isomerase-like protein
MDWGEDYIAAWNSQDIEALVAFFATTCRYTDVPHSMSWDGHDGIRKMFDAATAFHPDFEFTLREGFRDDRRYTFEWTCSGTVSGEKLSYEGVSVGVLDSDSRVIEQRDYYNAEDLHAALGPTA